MKLWSNLFCGLIVLFYIQCKKKKFSNKNLKTGFTICIQPLAGIDSVLVAAVTDSIKTFYPSVKIKTNKTLPTFAFYEKNNRYRADSLLQYLTSISNKNELMIGLTDKDISTTKDKIQDWGVMGLGSCPGNACIASTFRLRKENYKSQLFKVAIHELGHTQGLPHCFNKTCFMRDAEGKNPTDEEKAFCKSCTAYLKTKNWKL